MSEGRILMCVDGSEISQNAVAWYFDNFHKPSNRVIFCHVPEYWGNVQRMMSPAVLEEKVNETNAHTEKLQKNCDAVCKQHGADATFEVLKGDTYVWEAICQYAKKVNATCIVTGTRGMGTLKRTLLGSVSEGLLHHGHIPVLIYKQ